MKTQTIPVEGLPEWGRGNKDICFLIVEKIKTRRIVLEETEEDNQKNAVKNIWCAQFFSHNLVVVDQPKIWREVKETNIPLTNEEPKLSLQADHQSGSVKS